MPRAKDPPDDTEVAYYKGVLETFTDTPIVVLGLSDGRRYWPVRSVCKLLGISSSTQITRLSLDSEFASLLRDDLALPTSKGKRYPTFIDEEGLGGWLSNIQSQRVRPELQERLRRFRKAVWKFANAILNGTLQPVPPALAAPPAQPRLTPEDVQHYVEYLEQRVTRYERHTPVPVYIDDIAELDSDEAGVVRVPFVCEGCGKRTVIRLRLSATVAPVVVGVEEE